MAKLTNPLVLASVGGAVLGAVVAVIAISVIGGIGTGGDNPTSTPTVAPTSTPSRMPTDTPVPTSTLTPEPTPTPELIPPIETPMPTPDVRSPMGCIPAPPGTTVSRVSINAFCEKSDDGRPVVVASFGATSEPEGYDVLSGRAFDAFLTEHRPGGWVEVPGTRQHMAQCGCDVPCIHNFDASQVSSDADLIRVEQTLTDDKAEIAPCK